MELSLMAVTKAHVLMCLLRAGPLRKLREKQPPQTNWRSRCFLTWLRAVSEFSLMTLQYRQKASCLHFPLMLKDCLTRHLCRWKLIVRIPCQSRHETRVTQQLSGLVPPVERLTEQLGGTAGGPHWYTVGSSPPGL